MWGQERAKQTMCHVICFCTGALCRTNCATSTTWQQNNGDKRPFANWNDQYWVAGNPTREP
eukprot:1826832-Rhodomonas_salina.2